MVSKSSILKTKKLLIVVPNWQDVQKQLQSSPIAAHETKTEAKNPTGDVPKDGEKKLMFDTSDNVAASNMGKQTEEDVKAEKKMDMTNGSTHSGAELAASVSKDGNKETTAEEKTDATEHGVTTAGTAGSKTTAMATGDSTNQQTSTAEVAADTSATVAPGVTSSEVAASTAMELEKSGAAVSKTTSSSSTETASAVTSSTDAAPKAATASATETDPANSDKDTTKMPVADTASTVTESAAASRSESKAPTPATKPTTFVNSPAKETSKSAAKKVKTGSAHQSTERKEKTKTVGDATEEKVDAKTGAAASAVKTPNVMTRQQAANLKGVKDVGSKNEDEGEVCEPRKDVLKTNVSAEKKMFQQVALVYSEIKDNYPKAQILFSSLDGSKLEYGDKEKAATGDMDLGNFHSYGSGREQFDKTEKFDSVVSKGGSDIGAVLFLGSYARMKTDEVEQLKAVKGLAKFIGTVYQHNGGVVGAVGESAAALAAIPAWKDENSSESTKPVENSNESTKPVENKSETEGEKTVFGAKSVEDKKRVVEADGLPGPDEKRKCVVTEMFIQNRKVWAGKGAADQLVQAGASAVSADDGAVIVDERVVTCGANADMRDFVRKVIELIN